MMFDGKLRCNNLDDIILLLKSSDYIMHDICHAFDDCETLPESGSINYVLNLRRYHNLNPNSEFRCFYQKDDDNSDFILHLSQRHTTQYPEYLKNETLREELKEKIRTFVEDLDLGIGHIVIDVYLDPPPRRRIWLVDLAPWCPSTDPLLYTWDELNDGLPKEEFRYIEGQGQFFPSLDRYHKMPKEVAELSGYKHEELMKLVENAEKNQREREEQENREAAVQEEVVEVVNKID